MQDLLLFAGTVFMAFFAIMNPIATTPTFLGLTQGMDSRTRRLIAFKSLSLAFIIVVVFCLLGKLIFEVFGITLPAFRITGGILVFVVGFQLLHGKASPVQTPSAGDIEKSREAALSILVSPLAIPILAGPGAIATALNFAANASLVNVAITIGAFGVLCLVTYFMFRSAEKLVRFLGESTIKVVSRLMGLILAVVGTQMVLYGCQGAIKMFSE